jgi:predicted DsbA family dithiol-disulfide isomerase
VWSDIACPWCYVGKRRLEAAIGRMAEAGDIEVVWRAFELDPAAPRVQPPGTSYAERLARKYGTSLT